MCIFSKMSYQQLSGIKNLLIFNPPLRSPWGNAPLYLSHDTGRSADTHIRPQERA